MDKSVTPPSRQAEPPVTSADRNKEGEFKDTTTDADRGKAEPSTQPGSEPARQPGQR